MSGRQFRIAVSDGIIEQIGDMLSSVTFAHDDNPVLSSAGSIRWGTSLSIKDTL